MLKLERSMRLALRTGALEIERGPRAQRGRSRHIDRAAETMVANAIIALRASAR